MLEPGLSFKKFDYRWQYAENLVIGFWDKGWGRTNKDKALAEE